MKSFLSVDNAKVRQLSQIIKSYTTKKTISLLVFTHIEKKKGCRLARTVYSPLYSINLAKQKVPPKPETAEEALVIKRVKATNYSHSIVAGGFDETS